MLFNHYRPVSMFCILSKVFEKIMYDRLLNSLERYKILYDKQYGFRKKHSTYMALITLMDKLTNAIENGEYVIGIFLDFSKPFDTVNHDILLEKWEHYGIRGCALSWFRSYHSNRPQYDTYNGTTSMSQTIKCGVPQGSILGLLLFLICINDLGNVWINTMPLLFADDTNLFASGTNIIQLQDAVTNDLNNIAEWLKVNRLSLNIKKTHFMIFSKRKQPQPDVNIKIKGRPIEEVDRTKFLGTIVDNKLSWKYHISYISGKIARGIGIIKKARKFLKKESLLSLYYSFIYPYLIYCNHVWGNACKSYLKTLVVLQKKVVRIIAGVQPMIHTESLFIQINLLTCENLNVYLIGRLMHRIYNGKTDTFQSLFERNEEIHNHDTRQKEHYHIPSCKTNLGKKAWSIMVLLSGTTF